MSLEGICGSMFAGKSSELIRRLEREHIAGRRVVLFKHRADTRYAKDKVVAHNARKFAAIQIDDDDLLRIPALTADAEVVGFDEIHFFSSKMINVILQLVKDGKKVVFTGLNLNFRGEPFNDTIKDILPRCTNITYLTAICTYQLHNGKICGAEATMTQRLIDGKPASYDSPLVLIAGKDSYEARCIKHHEIPR